MTDTRERRLRSLADLLRGGDIASQEDATARLAALGFSVTQATVSRDLDVLGAVKIKQGGSLRYALPDQLSGRDWEAGRLARILREWAVGIEAAGQLIVIRTPPASAHLVASAIDHSDVPEIAGTIAGDDTLFLAVRDGHPIPVLLQRFQRMMGRGEETLNIA